MLLSDNKLTLTDDEVRELQVRIRRINKDPEKFKSRPDSEKEGLNYNQDGTWEVELNDLDDQNILRSIDVVHDSQMLREIFEQLTLEQLKRLIDSDLLRQITEDNFDDVWKEMSDEDVKYRIIDRINKDIIDKDTASEIANMYPISSMYGDLKDIIDQYDSERGISDEDIEKWVSEDLAYNVLNKNLDKSKVIEKFDIKLSDFLKKDKTEVIDTFNISIIDLIKIKLNKLFN